MNPAASGHYPHGASDFGPPKQMPPPPHFGAGSTVFLQQNFNQQVYIDTHHYASNLMAGGGASVEMPPPPVPGQEFAASATLPNTMPPMPSAQPQHSQAASGGRDAGLLTPGAH